MKRAIIIGATSGIGQEVAKNLLREGWQIGIAGRRQPALEDFQRIAPEQIKIQSLDVTQADAAEKLNTLIRKLGGMDLFLLSSGIGFQNPELDIDIELNTARTCRKKEKNTVLCPDCEELLRYAHARLDRCPFGEKKSSCKKCTVHCYKPVMRERMRQTMRFAGPRMIFYSPWAAIRHLLNL